MYRKCTGDTFTGRSVPGPVQITDVQESSKGMRDGPVSGMRKRQRRKEEK